MISVRIADIPAYLQVGGFYQGLDLEKTDESVSVPDDALKPDDTATKNEDLLHLLTSLQFWSVQKLPRNILIYVIDGPAFEASTELASFAQSFPLLEKLAAIRLLADVDDRVKYAIKNGVLEYLEYAHECGIQFDPSCCAEACKADQLEVLQYLVRNNYEIGFLAGVFAVEAGSTKCLAYWLTMMEPSEDTINAAASSGQIECLKVLYASGDMASAATLAFAAAAGQLDAIKYLREQGCEWDADACADAARNGHVQVLKYLHENGCPWDENAASDATAGGHLDCLIYAHTQGAHMEPDLCIIAAYSGRLECLKYLRQHNYPWDSRLCHVAAQYGKFDILQYAHENGCPWDSEATHAAALMAHYACLRYLVERGCPFDKARYEAELEDDPPYMPADRMREELKQNCVQS